MIIVAFYSFSLVSLKEGIRFSRDRHIWLMIAATIVSAFCGLYDKYLLQIVGLKPLIVQSWFSIYLVPVMLPIFIYWYRHDRETTPLRLRYSIPLIAFFLLFADYFYFVAIAQPDALISLITPLRRSSIVIAFLWGIFFLKEKNWQPKLACLVILWTGIYLISLGK
jgi:drug/metabolite transporter (DMT)-like permease